jgi:hypothetical protein
MCCVRVCGCACVRLVQALVYSLSAYSDDVDAGAGVVGVHPHPATLESRLPLLAPSTIGVGYHYLLLRPGECVCSVRWQPEDESGEPGAHKPGSTTLGTAVALSGPLVCVLTSQRVLLLSPGLQVSDALVA